VTPTTGGEPRIAVGSIFQESNHVAAARTDLALFRNTYRWVSKPASQRQDRGRRELAGRLTSRPDGVMIAPRHGVFE
jgi:hypothetical protein